MTDADLYGHDVVYVPNASKLAGYVPVSVEAGLDAGLWPWLAPDPCPIPELVLFPRLARALRRWTRGVR